MKTVAQRDRQGLAAADHPPQAGAVRGFAVLQKDLQHRRHEVQRGDALPPDDFAEIERVFMTFGLRHHQTRAGE